MLAHVPLESPRATRRVIRLGGMRSRNGASSASASLRARRRAPLVEGAEPRRAAPRRARAAARSARHGPRRARAAPRAQQRRARARCVRGPRRSRDRPVAARSIVSRAIARSMCEASDTPPRAGVARWLSPSSAPRPPVARPPLRTASRRRRGASRRRHRGRRPRRTRSAPAGAAAPCGSSARSTDRCLRTRPSAARPARAQPDTCSNAGPTMRIRWPSFLRQR